MSRHPVTDSRFLHLVWEANGKKLRDKPDQTAGYFKTIAPSPDGRDVRESKRPNLLDEPSTPDNKKPTRAKPRRDFRFDRKPLAEVIDYGHQIVKGLWEAKRADDLIGLYAVLHEHVFGVLPLELQQDYLMARASADKLLKDEFAGDALVAQQFVAWCWKRVAKGRKKNPDSDFRPGWRLQFKSRTWLTDFKASGRA